MGNSQKTMGMVWVARFELAACGFQVRHSTKLSYTQISAHTNTNVGLTESVVAPVVWVEAWLVLLSGHRGCVKDKRAWQPHSESNRDFQDQNLTS